MQQFPQRVAACVQPVLRARRCRPSLKPVGFALVALAATTGLADAAGYGLREQSASAIGNAFAGAAADAEDLTYMFSNPAGLTRQSGSQIVGVSTVVVPQLRFHDAEGSTSGGVPISGNQGGQNVGEAALIPAFYGLWDLQQAFDLQQNIKLGLGVNVPYGVETDYRDDWVGRYYAQHSRVMAIDVNPALAWEVVDGVSVAAGLQVQYIDARLTNAIDFGTIAGVQPGQHDGRGKVSGDDIGYGYTLGFLWEPWSGTRFGAGFRSAVHHTLEGDANFETGGAVGNAVANARGAFRDTGARTNLTTPETVNFGARHQLTPEVAVMANAEWTRWSRFHDLTIKYDNANQPNTVTQDDWTDTWFLALGATWRPDEAWGLRGGVAWDQDPTSDSRRTPRIPTDNRWWLSLGTTWKPLENLTLDAGYTHVFFEDASINLDSSGAGNQYRGNLTGSVEAAADIFALQARWVF